MKYCQFYPRAIQWLSQCAAVPDLRTHARQRRKTPTVVDGHGESVGLRNRQERGGLAVASTVAYGGICRMISEMQAEPRSGTEQTMASPTMPSHSKGREAKMKSWLWKGMLAAAIALPAPSGVARAQRTDVDGCSNPIPQGHY